MKKFYFAKFGCDTLEDVNAGSIFLEPKYNRAIIGITLDGSVLYEHFDLIHIVMEEEDCEEDFDSWEDYYDWAEENVMEGISYLFKNIKEGDVGPQLVILGKNMFKSNSDKNATS